MDVHHWYAGEALGFFEVVKTQQLLVVYHPLVQLQQVFKKWRGIWSKEIHVLPAATLCSVIGVWQQFARAYVLRKHPGMAMLSAEECGKDTDDDDDDDDESDD